MNSEHKSRMTAAAALVSAFLAVAAAMAPAGIVDFEGIVGIDGGGNPSLPGAGVKPIDWYFPTGVPLAVTNVPCPTGSATISQTKTSTVTWSLEVGAKAGVNWAAVSAELSATFGVELGKEESITIQKEVPASKYVSKEVRVHARYQRRRYTALGRTLDVYVPIGWYQVHKNINPKCPCEETGDARDQMDNYAGMTGPGPLQEQILTTVDQLNGVLALFDSAEPEDLLSMVGQGLNEVTHSLDQLVPLGGAPHIVEDIGTTLTRGVMDTIADQTLEEAVSHISDDPPSLPPNPFVEPATLALEDARLLAEDVGAGPMRFGAVGDLYAVALAAAFDARNFSFSDETVAGQESPDFLPDVVLPEPGDANTDGVVDDDDLSLTLASWGQDVGWENGEFSGADPVNDDDLSLLLANWTGATTVPEPVTLAVLVLGGVVLLAVRRRTIR